MVNPTGQTISAVFHEERYAEHAADEVIAPAIANDPVTITHALGTDTLPKDNEGFLDSVENSLSRKSSETSTPKRLDAQGFWSECRSRTKPNMMRF